MPIPTEAGAGFRVRIPAVLVRGSDSPTRIEARLGVDGVGTAATYTLYGPTGAVLVDAATATIASGVATYTVDAGDLPSTLSYGPGYREAWAITVGDVVQTATRPAVLARWPLHCPVTVADVEAVYPGATDTIRAADADDVVMQRFIDAAWEEAVRRLTQDGKWPEAVVDVETLVDPVREWALSRFFRWRSMDEMAGGRAAELADHHDRAGSKAWSQVRFRQDIDQDGVADSNDRASATWGLQRGAAQAYRYRTVGYTRGRVL